MIDKYFTWTASRIGGVGIDVDRAGSPRAAPSTPFPPSPVNGHAARRPAASTSGARTASTTSSIPRPSTSCRTPAAPATTRLFKEYTALVNNQSEQPLHAARAAGVQVAGRKPVPLEEVEPVEAIVQAVQDRRHVLRLDQQGSPRDAGRSP